MPDRAHRGPALPVTRSAVHTLTPNDRVPIQSDRFGVRPSFFWRRPDAVLVSASISALLDAGAPPTLDDSAMAVFVRTGFFVGDDTPFASIRAVPPAAV